MFLIRPQPIEGESLSSWRQRAGMANGFRHYPLLNENSRRTDGDRFPSQREVEWLAEQFRVSVERIREMSLEHIGEKLSDRFCLTSKPHWVVPMGRRIASSGGAYCPVCLGEDEVPHFKLAWRFAFVTSCPVHGCQLLEVCPRCSSRVWPPYIFRNASQRVADIGVCGHCGHRLHESPAIPTSDQQSEKLWRCVECGDVPAEVLQARTPKELFMGIWAISQLFIRNQSAHLLTVTPYRQAPPKIGTSKIELADACDREALVNAAYWLLQEWPDRFLRTANKADISRYHVTVSRAPLPPWLQKVVDKDLMRRRPKVSVENAEDVIQRLMASGDKVTKSVVRRALNVSEATVLKDLIPHRRNANWGDLEVLCAAFNEQIKSASGARDARATAVRDYLILLISILHGSSIENVCGMTKQNVMDVLHDCDEAIKHRQLIASAKELSQRYELSERGNLLGEKRSDSYWFLGRFGAKLAGHTVRARIAKLMSQHCDPALWNSADVFRKLCRSVPHAIRNIGHE